MWARFIKAVHGDNGHIDVIPKYSRSSIWLDIVRKVFQLKQKGIDLLPYCIKKVRNGVDTLFWDEVWLGDVMLKHIYPRVYALETNKLISVAEKQKHLSVIFSLRREPRGGTEHGQEIELSSRITDVVLSQMQDRWRWSLTGSRDFSVASVRKYIDDRSLPELHNQTRWVNAMPIKVNVLAWKVSLDNLPTRLNLSIRGMEINSILCPICSAQVESTDHLMFSCSFASELVQKKRLVSMDLSPFGEYGFIAAVILVVVVVACLKKKRKGEEDKRICGCLFKVYVTHTLWSKCRHGNSWDFVSPLDGGDGVVRFVLYDLTKPQALLDSLFSKGLRTVQFIPPKYRLGFSRVLKGALDKLLRETLAESSPTLSDVDDEDLDLVKVLSSYGVAPYSDATFEDLKTKHPFQHAPSLPHIPIDHRLLIASSTMVLDRIKSFPRGTSCGRDGLRAQHLVDCLSGAVVAVSDELRRLVSKVSATMIGHSLDGYLDGLQFDVGVSIGSEAILHVVNCLLEGCGDDVGL
ncbi:RNA-directed DNA polymerase, eukaryota, reverse transcriptase zinc-binding domain protein [Tanacetum coccineum]